jgi:hypothetical protein
MAMSTKADYTAEEWKAISGAPVATGLLVTLADASGPVGIAKEAMAVGKAIIQSASGEAPEIVRTLAETVKSGEVRPELPDIPKGDRTQTKNALIGLVKTAVRTVETKSPGEVEGFKAWLVSVAAKVAQASKEGGFLGFGGTLVSGEEEEALEHLNSLLGISPRGATRSAP